MSVLIKDMEMPDKCGCCKLFHAEYPMHCTAIKEYRTASAPYGMSRPDWCPLVEIKTPHGRLIDEIEAYDHIAEQEGGNYVDMDMVDMGLQETPTVIEAED